MEATQKESAISKVTFRCVQMLILLALPTLLTAGKECTRGVTYLDPVTGNCDPCSDICEQSLEQGTRARCDKMCKGYIRLTPICPPGQYFDKNVDRCDSCSTVCLHPHQGDCRTLCPDWSKKDITEKTSSNADKMNNTTHPSPAFAAHGGDNKENESIGITGQSYVSLVLIGIGVLFVVVFGLLVFVLRKPCAKKIKEISAARRCNRHPTQEQGTRMLPENPIVRPGKGPFAQTDSEDMA